MHLLPAPVPRLERKEDVLALVGHELRNPLTAILGWIHMLRAEALSPAQTDRALERIEHAARAQARLLDDLLDVPRLVSGKLRLELHDLAFAAVVEDALESARPVLAARRLRLETGALDRAAMIRGDALRLQQVIWNLVSNAVKFTPEGGTIAITVARIAGRAELTVADDGEGLSAELLGVVFERFRQGARVSRGLGLGLWIARQLVEHHGGSIGATSPGPGRGATFVVRLPLVEAT